MQPLQNLFSGGVRWLSRDRREHIFFVSILEVFRRSTVITFLSTTNFFLKNIIVLCNNIILWNNYRLNSEAFSSSIDFIFKTIG